MMHMYFANKHTQLPCVVRCWNFFIATPCSQTEIVVVRAKFVCFSESESWNFLTYCSLHHPLQRHFHEH